MLKEIALQDLFISKQARESYLVGKAWKRDFTAEKYIADERKHRDNGCTVIALK